MANKYETKIIPNEAIRDTDSRYSGAVMFGKAGFGHGVLIIENDLNQDTTIQLMGKPDAGSNWQNIGDPIATGASTQDNYSIAVPWALLRISYAADSTPTGGNLNVYLDMAKGGAGSTVSLASGSSIEVEQDTHNDLNANANLQVGNVDVSATNPVYIRSATVTPTQTPTVTTSAYTADDAVGGLLTFANAARETGGGGVITDILITDDAGQDAIMELWLFNQAFTPIADADLWAPSEADLENLVAIISTEGDSWKSAGTPSSINVEVTRGYDLIGTSLFGQLVTRGTPTPAAADDITVKIKCIPD